MIFPFKSMVTDLEAVVDSLGLKRFPLLGISQGAAVSIEYAVRHPHRVSHLILLGGYSCGWRHWAEADEYAEREALMTLVKTGWGKDSPLYRQIFSESFLPSATGEELEWFNSFQRQTVSPSNAARFLETFSRIDVRHRLPELELPTLILHARGDRRVGHVTGNRAGVLHKRRFAHNARHRQSYSIGTGTRHGGCAGPHPRISHASPYQMRRETFPVRVR